MLHTLTGHANAVWAMAFAADGRLATGSHDHTVKVWMLPIDDEALVWSAKSNLAVTLTTPQRHGLGLPASPGTSAAG